MKHYRAFHFDLTIRPVTYCHLCEEGKIAPDEKSCCTSIVSKVTCNKCLSILEKEIKMAKKKASKKKTSKK